MVRPPPSSVRGSLCVPTMRVWDERNGELGYTLRTESARFKPWVFAEGTYTVRLGEPPARMTTRTGQQIVPP